MESKQFMGSIGVGLLISLSSHFAFAGSSLTAEQALKKLLDGNKRYMQSKLIHPDQSSHRIADIAQVQHPFATILGCSDSRVPPEIIFDQGLGDLFVIREAGNIADSVTLGSLEYAVEHLGVSIILVLGHERCGAITAAVENDQHAHLKFLVDEIRPAVAQAKKEKGDLIDLAVRKNIALVAEKIRLSKPVLAQKIKSGQIKLVEGYYNLETGKVEILN